MTPQVTFLDDNEDLRTVIQSLIEFQLGMSCLSIASFQQMKKYSAEVLNSQVIILDIELGMNQPSGIDAFKWLISQSFQGRIFFLTGHGRSHPLVREAEKAGVTIWEKPISATEMVRAITSVLPAGSSLGVFE